MAWGAVAGAVIGGVMANKAANKQSGAMDRASALQAQGYTDARPYVQSMYSKGTDALNQGLDTGFYSGPTYASMNNQQTTGANNLYNFGNNAYNNAGGMMNTAGQFGTNYANIYSMANANRLNNATAYADANAQPLVDNALRDSTRNLEESTLRNIGMRASNTGNTNSSRTGVANAIAGRDYMDRAADTSSNVRDDLIRRSLQEQDSRMTGMMNANAGLANTYNTAFGMGNTAANNQVNAGAMFQKDTNNMYQDAKANFDGRRDFDLDLINKYNAGILGRAPQTAGSVRPNLVDPTVSAFGGAMAGYGAGEKFQNLFPQQAQPTVYGGYGNSGPSTGFGYGGSSGNSSYLYGDGYLGGD